MIGRAKRKKTDRQTERERERDKVEDTETTLYHKVTLKLPAAIL